MLTMRKALVIAAMLITAPLLVQGELYQYTDKNGNTVYTDSPPQNTEVKQKRLRENGVSWSSHRPDPPAAGAQTVAARQTTAARRNKDYSQVNVVMYMTDW